MFGKTQVPLEMCHVTWSGAVFFPVPSPPFPSFSSWFSVYPAAQPGPTVPCCIFALCGSSEAEPHPLPCLLFHLSLFSWGGGPLLFLYLVFCLSEEPYTVHVAFEYKTHALHDDE